MTADLCRLPCHSSSTLSAMSLYITDSDRWTAVQARDPAADRMFVYAVHTTKIYCRPVCKSRRARRANVSFYSLGQDAERAGFRPCKRCKPEVGGGMPEEAAVARIRSLVELELGILQVKPDDQSCSKVKRTSDLAQRAQVSKWHFHRVFKDVTGMTPAEFAARKTGSLYASPQRGSESWNSCIDSALTSSNDEALNSDFDNSFSEFDWGAIINDADLNMYFDAKLLDEMLHDSTS